MADNVVLNINMGVKCVECRKPGATDSGICLKCATKAMDFKRPMKTPQGAVVQARYKAMFDKLRSKP